MSRFYTVLFNKVAVTAQQDLILVKNTAATKFRVHEVRVSQNSDAGDAESEQLAIELARIPATVTNGSGGGAMTPAKLDPLDPAATVTARINDTSGATSSGTVEVFFADSMNVLGPGFQYLPTPETRPIFAVSEALAVRLKTTPNDSLTMSGTALIEEL